MLFNLNKCIIFGYTKKEKDMTTLEIIKTHIENVTGAKSFYTELGDKLVRVSDHLPNTENFWRFNEGVEKVLLVFVSSEYNTIDERTASLYCDKVRGLEIEYLIIN